MNTKLIVILLVTLVLAACASPSTPAPAASAPTEPAEEQETFELGIFGMVAVQAGVLQTGKSYYFVPGTTGVGGISVYSLAQGTVIGFLIERLIEIGPGAIQDLTEGPRVFYWDGQYTSINRATGEIRIYALEDGNTAEAGSAAKYDFTASHQPPEGWNQPPRDHCGEDMVEYYTLLFLSEAVTLFASNAETFAVLEKSALAQGIDQYSNKADEIGNRLREKSCYFYKGGGSVFMDYKWLRHRFWKVDAAQVQWVQANISLDMPTSQAYELAKQLVSQWW